MVNQVDIRRIILAEHADARGSLNVAEAVKNIPFDIARVFWISNVPQGQRRGGHAHWTCHEAVFAAQGSVCITLDEGKGQEDFILSKPNEGVIIPAGAWCELHGFTPDTVLVVLASEAYNPDGYCHNHEAWLRLLDEKKCN